MKLKELFETTADEKEQRQINLVSKDGWAIENIKNPSEAVQLAAVCASPATIQHIYNRGIIPSEAVQLAAVGTYGYVIYYIKNPSEAVQLAAVNNRGAAIRYLANPSEVVQLAAVSNDDFAITHISHPYPSVIKAALTKSSLINNKYHGYDRVVTSLFANNIILMKKWLRYGQAVRS